jgi:hypothetical protein
MTETPAGDVATTLFAAGPTVSTIVQKPTGREQCASCHDVLLGVGS